MMSERTWFSPHGTEWRAETYEEALEDERDALAARLAEIETERDEALRMNAFEVDVQVKELRRRLAREQARKRAYRAERDDAHAALRAVQAAAGHPDAAEGCRNVITIARAVLRPSEPTEGR
jgi:peptidoglycan hydrolase CwlO-like protein